MTVAETQATFEAYADGPSRGRRLRDLLRRRHRGHHDRGTGRDHGAGGGQGGDRRNAHRAIRRQPQVENLVIGEGTGALEAVFVGTHTGEFAGIAATGIEVAVPYSVFYELADGKITNLRIYALVEGIVQQLQAAPSASTDASRNGELHLTKECSEYTAQAGSFCTVVSSNFDAIPTGSKSFTKRPTRPTAARTPTL